VVDRVLVFVAVVVRIVRWREGAGLDAARRQVWIESVGGMAVVDVVRHAAVMGGDG
jgi:hypothetical protein